MAKTIVFTMVMVKPNKYNISDKVTSSLLAACEHWLYKSASLITITASALHVYIYWRYIGWLSKASVRNTVSDSRKAGREWNSGRFCSCQSYVLDIVSNCTDWYWHRRAGIKEATPFQSVRSLVVDERSIRPSHWLHLVLYGWVTGRIPASKNPIPVIPEVLLWNMWKRRRNQEEQLTKIHLQKWLLNGSNSY